LLFSLELQDLGLLPGEVRSAEGTVGAGLLEDGSLQVQFPEKEKKPIFLLRNLIKRKRPPKQYIQEKKKNL
jgi:hypothetical protein